MTCPTCQRHAQLLTSDEFDAKHDDGISGDSALLARDIMIDECRTQVKGNSNGTRVPEDNDGRRVLHAVSPVLLVHEPARAVTRIAIDKLADAQTAMLNVAFSLLALARGMKRGLVFEEDIPAAVAEVDKVFAALGIPPFNWDGPAATTIAKQPQEFRHAAE